MLLMKLATRHAGKPVANFMITEADRLPGKMRYAIDLCNEFPAEDTRTRASAGPRPPRRERHRHNRGRTPTTRNASARERTRARAPGSHRHRAGGAGWPASDPS